MDGRVGVHAVIMHQIGQAIKQVCAQHSKLERRMKKEISQNAKFLSRNNCCHGSLSVSVIRALQN